jgi:hypothetical protein
MQLASASRNPNSTTTSKSTCKNDTQNFATNGAGTGAVVRIEIAEEVTGSQQEMKG